MVSIVSQPYTSANFSYSSSMGQNNQKQLRQFGPDDLRRCMKEGLIYPEIKEQYPKLPQDRYRKMLKAAGYQPDNVRLTRRIDNDIVQLHNSGASAETIAEKYNWKVSYCKHRLNRLGISTMKFEKVEEPPKSFIDEIRKMAEEKGMSQTAIAKKLKKQPVKIREIMIDNDIYTPAMKRAEAIANLKKSTMAAALAKFGGNIKEASESLGISIAAFKKYSAFFKLHV